MALPNYEKRINQLKELEKTNTYSTNEILTGKTWIDGKPIYRKVIDTGSFANVTSNEIFKDMGKINIKNMVDLYGFAKDTNGAQIKLPYISGNLQSAIQITPNTVTNQLTVAFKDYTHYKVYTESYVTIEYTKTTD